MAKSFTVVYSAWNGDERTWTEHRITSRRSPRSARLVANCVANHKPDMRETRLGPRHRGSVEVKLGSTQVWEHPGVLVPSVAEMGWW